MAITITTASNALGQHCVKYSDKINQTLRQGLEFEMDLPKVSCDYSYQGVDVSHSDVLQPYQKAHTPNNSENFNGIENILQIGKIDLTYDWLEIVKFYDKWKCNFFEAGKTTQDWTFPKYMMDQVVIPKFLDDLNAASWSGIYAAPTPGTPGAAATTFTGFGKKIADAITATDITPINTGALVGSTMVAQMQTFCAGVPIRYRFLEGVIEMSKTNAQKYAADFNAKNPGREVVEKDGDKQYLKVDHYNKRIIGRTSMEGSDRIILRFPKLDSLIIGTKNGVAPLPKFRFIENGRELWVQTELFRFFGFETYSHMFVNDQA